MIYTDAREGSHIIRVMLIDDEFPALKIAESVLNSFDDVSICGIFSDPDELLTCLPTSAVDLLFVDMKMPGMHGLELAGRIQEMKPEASIVFVTAYDDYAVDAYETDALDYIMKPITAERMEKTFERYIKRHGIHQQDLNYQHIIVRSFGRFSVENNAGKTMRFRTAKTEELLALLLHHRGNPVTKERIMEELWYDRDGERAQSMLYTTLYQLRKDLEGFGLRDIILHSRKEGGLCRLSWTPDEWDYQAFTEGYRQYKADQVSLEQVKHIVELHTNGYLAENGYRWADERRNDLELCCAELLEELANAEVNLQRFEFALQHLKKWADMFPFTERAHFKIIALYLLMNKKDAANLYYRQMKEMFAEELGIPLQIDIDELAKNPGLAFQQQKP